MPQLTATFCFCWLALFPPATAKQDIFLFSFAFFFLLLKAPCRNHSGLLCESCSLQAAAGQLNNDSSIQSLVLLRVPQGLCPMMPGTTWQAWMSMVTQLEALPSHISKLSPWEGGWRKSRERVTPTLLTHTQPFTNTILLNSSAGLPTKDNKVQLEDLEETLF